MVATTFHLYKINAIQHFFSDLPASYAQETLYIENLKLTTLMNPHTTQADKTSDN